MARFRAKGMEIFTIPSTGELVIISGQSFNDSFPQFGNK
jgi:hypothetical protein